MMGMYKRFAIARHGGSLIGRSTTAHYFRAVAGSKGRRRRVGVADATFVGMGDRPLCRRRPETLADAIEQHGGQATGGQAFERTIGQRPGKIGGFLQEL